MSGLRAFAVFLIAVAGCEPRTAGPTDACSGTCADPTPFCDVDTGKCVQCTEDADCNGKACCNNKCVDVRTSIDNCGQCGKSCTVANGKGTCKDSACTITSCNAGFANCDSNVVNGCEAQTTTDPMNCGGCKKVCPGPANGTAMCAASMCVSLCQFGYSDCDGLTSNGCETELKSNPANCGACRNACTAPPNSTALCSNGLCGVGTCSAGFADCDQVASNGCEVALATSVTNCGSCGNACVAPANATALCKTGQCVVGSCKAGFSDCDMNPATGCETPTAMDPMNCGACGKVCVAGANSTATCTSSLCGIVCAMGFGNCDALASNGCEKSLTSDPLNCGACGKSCGAPLNATAACMDSACVITACKTGYNDCDKVVTNGCESNPLTDVKNCGACGMACPVVANATATCGMGACSYTCLSGYTDCDKSATNGCEVRTSADPMNCGTCGNACSLPNATAACTNGLCAVSVCTTGFANCDASAVNGCERPTSADTANCGGCGRVCTAFSATTACTNATCSIASCTAPYADCDKIYSNGCEVNTATNVSHCGGCGMACPAAMNATVGCAAGVCGITSCKTGFANCDGTIANGCELPILTDVNNCGGCDKVCAAITNGTPTCTNGVCGAVCGTGFANCDSNLVNGCEANLSTDAKNCAACGLACNYANGVGVCTAKVCSLGSCNAGWANCDGNAANGCEMNVWNSVANCGVCGKACAANQVCVGGSCVTGIKVLLVHAETAAYVTDLVTRLQGTNAFTTVDTFDASTATPTAAQLKAYDTVLVWSHSQFAANSTLGDNLATYYDGGGNVVVAVFAFGSAPLAGRFGTVASGYVLLDPAASYAQTAASFGTILESTSPLVAGVATLSSTTAYRSLSAVQNGGVVVAKWSDAMPLVVRGVVKNRNRVDLNLWPITNTAVSYGLGGDLVTLLKNALLYR